MCCASSCVFVVLSFCPFVDAIVLSYCLSLPLCFWLCIGLVLVCIVILPCIYNGVLTFPSAHPFYNGRLLAIIKEPGTSSIRYNGRFLAAPL